MIPTRPTRPPGRSRHQRYRIGQQRYREHDLVDCGGFLFGVETSPPFEDVFVVGSDLADPYGHALVVHGYLVAGYRRLGELLVELAEAEVAEGRRR